MLIPTFKNARPIWRELAAIFWQVQQYLRVYSRTDLRIETPANGCIQFFTDENADAMRGDKFHYVYIDEAARIREETYYDVVVPTLADYDGECDAWSTPRGRNWFYREHLAGLDPLQQQRGGGIRSFHAPTSANPLPNIQRACVEAAIRFGVDSRTYRQEWLAEFLEEGAVFRGVRAASILPPMPAVHGHNYFFGVDWGRSHDFTVVSVFDATTREQVYLDRFTGVEYPAQLIRIRGLYERYRPVTILAEENSIGLPQIENMRRQGFRIRGFKMTNASKAEIVDHFSLQLETGAISLQNDPVQIGELEAFEATQLAAGFRYAAPDGMHDDTCIGAMLSVWAASTTMDPVSEAALARVVLY